MGVYKWTCAIRSLIKVTQRVNYPVKEQIISGRVDKKRGNTRIKTNPDNLFIMRVKFSPSKPQE